jgi:hypothetical protein
MGEAGREPPRRRTRARDRARVIVADEAGREPPRRRTSTGSCEGHSRRAPGVTKRGPDATACSGVTAPGPGIMQNLPFRARVGDPGTLRMRHMRFMPRPLGSRRKGRLCRFPAPPLIGQTIANRPRPSAGSLPPPPQLIADQVHLLDILICPSFFPSTLRRQHPTPVRVEHSTPARFGDRRCRRPRSRDGGTSTPRVRCPPRPAGTRCGRRLPPPPVEFALQHPVKRQQTDLDPRPHPISPRERLDRPQRGLDLLHGQGPARGERVIGPPPSRSPFDRTRSPVGFRTKTVALCFSRRSHGAIVAGARRCRVGSDATGRAAV